MLVNTNLGHQNVGQIPCPRYIRSPRYIIKEVFKVSKISYKWEEILPQTRRLKVFGGWFVETWAYDEHRTVTATTAIFVPDPNHEWEI